jgi:penicillin-binding protein 1A
MAWFGKGGKVRAKAGAKVGGGRASAASAPASGLKRRRWGMFFLKAAAVVAVWGAVLAGGFTAYVFSTLPDTAHWMQVTRPPSITLLADDGSVIATYGDFYGQELRLSDLPPSLPQAVIATEDRRFYSHFGLDPIGMARALWVDLRAGSVVQGGSTITQQLAKNVFLTPERSIMRKLQEAVLAIWLEQHYTKDQLLAAYLNRVYFGAGAYGVDAAARRYFGKSARDLDVFQSALIAGLLKAPSHFSPSHDHELAAARARQVIDNMVAAGYLTPGQAATAKAESASLGAVPIAKAGPRYFADWIQDAMANGGYTSDVVVKTTLDPRLQAAAEAAITKQLDQDGARLHVSQGTLLALSPDGAVRAMVGGRDYTASQFNRVTQATRQPGSSFKLFVYLTALERGLEPDSTFVDGPISVGGWQPHDYEKGYRGAVTMAEAVAQSINTVAVEVALRVGIKNVVATAHRLGITTAIPDDASIALGTADVSLLDLTSAYAVMANGGNGVWPYGITEIKDTQGHVLFTRTGGGPGRLVAPAVVGQMNRLLTGVLQYGTGRAAAIGRPAAGKTGTTSDFRDAWFEGYTPDLVAGVWFGNDDDTPMRHVSGGSLPARAWHDFMVAALAGTPHHELPGTTLPPPVVASASASVQPAASRGVGDAIGDFLSRSLATIGIGNGAAAGSAGNTTRK